MERTIIMYPSPGRSHVVPMLELAKLILTHHPSFSITIFISTAPFETGSTSDYIAEVVTTCSSITFHHLPPTSMTSSARGYNPTLYFEFGYLNNINFKQAILALSNISKPKALIIDLYCSSAFDIATEFNIPTYYFFPSGANALAVLLHFPLLDKTTKDSLKDLHDTLIHVPGVPSLPAKNMPTGMLDRTLKVYDFFLNVANQLDSVVGIISNTFEMLESRAIKAITNGPTPLYCIGPLIASHEETKIGVDGGNEYMNWLSLQPSQSVLFVNFGSFGLFPLTQLKEMAIGLEKSGVKFLWVVRNPPCRDDTSPEPNLESLFPEAFLERTKEKGLVIRSWVNQVAVLSHDSVGGFLNHCGWNSVLESVRAGVPMLGWPLHAENKINGAFLTEEAKLGLPVVVSENGLVSSGELEKKVSELMNSEKGEAIRERVMVMREGLIDAVSEGGSSLVALAKLAKSFE